jgi:hypothetical protein
MVLFPPRRKSVIYFGARLPKAALALALAYPHQVASTGLVRGRERARTGGPVIRKPTL